MTHINKYRDERFSGARIIKQSSKMNYDLDDYFSLITSESELAELERKEREYEQSRNIDKKPQTPPVIKPHRDKQYFILIHTRDSGNSFPKQFPRPQKTNSMLNNLMKERIDLSDPQFETNVNFTPNYTAYSTDLY